MIKKHYAVFEDGHLLYWTIERYKKFALDHMGKWDDLNREVRPIWITDFNPAPVGNELKGK